MKKKKFMENINIKSLLKREISIVKKKTYNYYCNQELLLTEEDKYVFHYLKEKTIEHFINLHNMVNDDENIVYDKKMFYLILICF